MTNETLIPYLGVVNDIRIDTPDVKTFRVLTPDGKKPFDHMPGQCAMLSIPGVGEALFSITSSPTNTEFMEFSIKKCGCVTSFLHAIEPGQYVTIRGPYGNGFPVESAFKGKDLLFVAGFGWDGGAAAIATTFGAKVDGLNVDATSYNAVIQEQSMGIHYNVGKSVLDYIKNQGYTNVVICLQCNSIHIGWSALLFG